jgi:membrane protein YfhO
VSEALAPRREDRPSSLWTRPLPSISIHDQTVRFVALLALLLTGLFREAIFQHRVFFNHDIQLMWYTQVETFVRAVAAHEWPLWNPYIGFGQPLLADANTQVLYPPTWLHLLMRPWTYYTGYVIGHLLLAGTGLFALARRLGMSRGASATAALAWIASGPLLSVVDIWNQLAGVAWMPWAGMCAIAALQTGRRRWAVAWGACQAAQVLCGSVESALMTAAGVAAYAIVMRPWQDGTTPLRRSLLLAVLAVVTAVGLSAGQWVPSVMVAARSARVHLPAEMRTYWSVHPATLLQMWLPVPLHALHLSAPVRRALFEGREPLLASLYLGLPGLALVGAALVERRRTTALVAGGLLVSVLVALGRHTPAYGWLTAIPPLTSVRYPVKAMLAASLCWALLAGHGFDAWASTRPVPRRPWLGSVIAPTAVATLVCAGLAIALALFPERVASSFLTPPEPGVPIRELLIGTVPSLAAAAAAALLALGAAAHRAVSVRRAWPGAVAVAALTVVPMAAWHDGLCPTAPRELYTARPPLVDALARSDHARVYVYDYNVPGKSRAYLGRDFAYAIRGGPPGWSYPAAKALALHLALFPPIAGAWGMAGSFDRDTPGLAPRFLSDLCDVVILVEGTAAHLRLLQIGDVADMVALHTAGLQRLRPVATADALMAEPVRVLEVPDPLPRAYAVSGVRVADGSAAIGALLDAGLDPRREIVLPSGPSLTPDPAFRGTVVVRHLGMDRITLDADLSGRGYVVLVDAYDPGWRAWVDGRESAIVRANVAFRAVAVEAGRHTVEMRYRPRELILGAALSALALAALAAGGAAAVRRTPLS